MAIVEQLMAISAVLVLLVAAALMLGRSKGRRLWLRLRSGSGTDGCMTVTDRLVLTPQHVLHMVRAGERRFLVATHPQGVSFDPAGETPGVEFRSVLARTQEATK
jgi:hypothetical protein